MFKVSEFSKFDFFVFHPCVRLLFEMLTHEIRLHDHNDQLLVSVLFYRLLPYQKSTAYVD